MEDLKHRPDANPNQIVWIQRRATREYVKTLVNSPTPVIKQPNVKRKLIDLSAHVLSDMKAILPLSVSKPKHVR